MQVRAQRWLRYQVTWAKTNKFLVGSFTVSQKLSRRKVYRAVVIERGRGNVLWVFHLCGEGTVNGCHGFKQAQRLLWRDQGKLHSARKQNINRSASAQTGGR